MTDAAIRLAHPFDPATDLEFLAGRQILAAAGLLAESVRFAYYGLEEPPEHEVLGRDAGQPDRRLRAFLIDWPGAA
jgi:primary-amine oxidase